MSKTLKIMMLCIWFFAMANLLQAQSSWVAPSEAVHVKNPLTKNKDITKKGEKLYSQFCTVCHGVKGKGNGVAGAALQPRPADFTKSVFTDQTDGAIFWKIATGKPPMAPYKGVIKDDEIWSIIHYIRTISKN